MSTTTAPTVSKDPGHKYAETNHISFDFYDQRISNAPFGYEHYVSLPPTYAVEPNKKWPLILFLHGAGESQKEKNESYITLRHGIPKIILCYDKLKEGMNPPSIDIPIAERLRKGLEKQNKQGDKSTDPVDPEVAHLVTENFITVTPSLNLEYGYGWNVSVLSALLDEIEDRFRIDVDRVHVTGFSMGGAGTWGLGMHSPHRFATLTPICGYGDKARASVISNIPQWVHHGDLDDIVPLKDSREMVEALQKAGADEVKFTRYEDLMHDSWTAAYNNIDVFLWMLHRTRREKGDERVVPASNKAPVIE